MYELYKPLRNLISKFALTDSLVSVWELSQFLCAGRPVSFLPHGSYINGRRIAIEDYVHQWTLTMMAREFLMHAKPDGTRTLQRFNDLRAVINGMQDVHSAFLQRELEAKDVFVELHRIGHHQFRWQTNNDAVGLMRYRRVYEHEGVKDLIETKIGMSLDEVYAAGMLAYLAAQAGPWIAQQGSFEQLGVSDQAKAAFFTLLTANVNHLRQEAVKAQSYSAAWPYTFNPLTARPLIRMSENIHAPVLCPIPLLIIRRISEGLYYDMVNERGFSDAMGNAFEQYVGAFARTAFNRKEVIIRSEEPYTVSKQRKHGVDWIISDQTANLFVESKTKRLRHNAKAASDLEELSPDLTVLAAAVVQNYKNIRDAVCGRTSWMPNGLPSFNLIVTFDDWYLFGPSSLSKLHTLVKQALAEHEMSEGVMNDVPYAILSAPEFEAACCACDQATIEEVFRKKSDEVHSEWLMDPFLIANHQEARRSAFRLQQMEWQAYLEKFRVTGKTLSATVYPVQPNFREV
jgi:hypothetical protein